MGPIDWRTPIGFNRLALDLPRSQSIILIEFQLIELSLTTCQLTVAAQHHRWDRGQGSATPDWLPVSFVSVCLEIMAASFDDPLAIRFRSSRLLSHFKSTVIFTVIPDRGRGRKKDSFGDFDRMDSDGILVTFFFAFFFVVCVCVCRHLREFVQLWINLISLCFPDFNYIDCNLIERVASPLEKKRGIY